MNFNERLTTLQERALSNPLLTLEQVCELMQTSASTLYRMRKDGDGPAWVRVRGAIRYRRSAVEEYLQSVEHVSAR